MFLHLRLHVCICLCMPMFSMHDIFVLVVSSPAWPLRAVRLELHWARAVKQQPSLAGDNKDSDKNSEFVDEEGSAPC